MLGAQAATPEREEVDVVLEDAAQAGVGVGESELVLSPLLEEAVAAEAGVEERCDGTGVLVGERRLPEKAPAVSLASLDEVLPERVTERPGASLRLDDVDGGAGDDPPAGEIEPR